ncbi:MULTISPECIES: CGA synthase-related protein [Streptomyces]|uniref:CGA synthase-related protein n=1 Tax=Streptomyces changanensis TaxID=2964669 RepID=A0ABY5NEU9_9ACTN|nr:MULTISPECIES: CGA synthase-related protein [Streptomyces]UUS34519.1 CGA synthase-related protein [Streptomyces changanensis]
MSTTPPKVPAATRHRLLVVARDDALDSLLAGRRIAAHTGDLCLTRAPGPGARAGHEPDGPRPDVALVCDDRDATGRLLALGVPVVHLRSGHEPGAAPADEAPAGALHRVHLPGWLPGPRPTGRDVRTTGTLAPTRLSRGRTRAGTLLLLSLWGVPEAEAAAFVDGPMVALAREAARRTGHCDIVHDTAGALVRSALGPDAAAAGTSGSITVHRAAEADVDALHARADVCLASPTLAALTLAQARRAPLTLLPPLGAVQRDLAERTRGAVSLPEANDPADPELWAAPRDPAADPWRELAAAPDDLRGAQRVARTLRQLSFAPL